MTAILSNYVANEWRTPQGIELADIPNPATGEILARVPMTSKADTATAVEAASAAATAWARVPAIERIQYLFKLKTLIEQNLDELCRICTNECGKTYGESKGEFQRAIENIETACGIPILMQGHTSEDIARGIDEYMFRQPMGVVAAITPFNFPGMIPFWFLPYALATGNCMILKPSEKTPMTAARVFELIASLGLPPGVLQMVHGGRDAVETLLEHPAVRAISFVGSSDVARIVYQGSARHGKRAQCQGGAKNPVVILPDADMDMAVKIVADAAFGCAGQRCLALSQVIAVGDAREAFMERIAEVARSRKVGYGLADGVEMGPVIRPESKARIESLIAQAESDGATLRVDGRGRKVDGYENGNFVFPTVIENLPPESVVQRTEIFGPVLTSLRWTMPSPP